MNSNYNKDSNHNYSSSGSLSPEICFCNDIHSCKKCRLLITPRPELLASYMPHQDLSETSHQSSKSAPMKQSVECFANPGYFRKNGENMNMLITKENYKLCCEEIKKELDTWGNFCLTSVVNQDDLDSDLVPPVPEPHHLAARDLRLTCGANANLQYLQRCLMYKTCCLCPIFLEYGGADQAKGYREMCRGSSNVQASAVINDTGKTFESLFWKRMSRAHPDSELPV